jgi:hypothetical protein
MRPTIDSEQRLRENLGIEDAPALGPSEDPPRVVLPVRFSMLPGGELYRRYMARRMAEGKARPNQAA